MLADLLALAADQGQIVGMRIQPGEATFQVHVWVGPGMGERMEWFDEFPAERSRIAAVDAVAARVIACCRETGESAPIASVFAWGERVTTT